MTRTILYDYVSSICSQMARLALAEKGVAYTRRSVDIMVTSEQFQPWYVALNPRAVVPTLDHGGTIVTDTKVIVAYIDNSFPGPDLQPAGPEVTRRWLDHIMGLHYGMLMYAGRIGADGALPPQITARGEMLARVVKDRPELADMLARRIEGNARMQAMLRDPAAVQRHRDDARALVDEMAAAVADAPFLTGNAWSLADAFATAALARFHIHGFTSWWRVTPLAAYYARMKARPSFAAAQVIDQGSEADL